MEGKKNSVNLKEKEKDVEHSNKCKRERIGKKREQENVEEKQSLVIKGA